MDQNILAPTLREFYSNPSGKGITSNNINIVRKDFIKRYDIVTKQEKKKVKTDIYMENETSFYFHMLIPSDMHQNTYDVVLHMYNLADDGNERGSLKDWSINVFSNCPSFVFTYAVSYNEAGLLIPFLTKKYNNKVLHLLPVEKNPDLTIGWDKSIFYAIHTLMTNITMTQRFILKRNSKPFDPKALFDEIRTEAEIMRDVELGKTVRVRTFGTKRTMATKVKDEIADGLKHAAVKAVDAVKGTKSDGVNQKSDNRFKVNINSKGKIVGASKITGRNRSRRR